MKSGKIILYPVLICLLLGTGYFFGQKDKTSFLGQKLSTVSPDFMALTQPVHSFAGIIDKIEGNTVTVKQQVPSYSPPVAVVSPGQTIPTPVIKFLSYKFSIIQNTQISKYIPQINYLFKTVTPAPPVILSLKDLKNGQLVSIQTNADLRLNSSSNPEATAINIQTTNIIFSGKITETGDQMIKVLGYPPGQPSINNMTPVQTKEYVVNVSLDAEISRYSPIETGTANGPPQPQKPEKLTFADLKKDMQVNVFLSDTNITSSTALTALRIEPLYSPVINPNPVIPTILPLEEPVVTSQETTGANKLSKPSKVTSPNP